MCFSGRFLPVLKSNETEMQGPPQTTVDIRLMYSLQEAHHSRMPPAAACLAVSTEPGRGQRRRPVSEGVPMRDACMSSGSSCGLSFVG